MFNAHVALNYRENQLYNEPSLFPIRTSTHLSRGDTSYTDFINFGISAIKNIWPVQASKEVTVYPASQKC